MSKPKIPTSTCPDCDGLGHHVDEGQSFGDDTFGVDDKISEEKEDEQDAATAAARLKEIKDVPERLIQGGALIKRLGTLGP